MLISHVLLDNQWCLLENISFLLIPVDSSFVIMAHLQLPIHQQFTVVTQTSLAGLQVITQQQLSLNALFLPMTLSDILQCH